MYVIDDGTIREQGVPDSFHIKTLNSKKNDFSSCLVYDIDELKAFVLPYCEKGSDFNKWVVTYDNDPNEIVNTTDIRIHPKLRTDLCLVNYYDELGKNQNKLISCNDPLQKHWKYSTLLPDELPNKVEVE